MPTWPTLYPGLQDGRVNTKIDTRPVDVIFKQGQEKDPIAQRDGLTLRQK